MALHSFNTGRLYQSNGQIIEWEIVDGWVKFYDRSRMINGTFRKPDPLVIDDDWVVDMKVDDKLVLRYYDKGWYDNI